MNVLLETERLVLRRFAKSDADHLFRLDGDPEVMRYLTDGTPTSRTVIERDVLPLFLQYGQGGAGLGFWAVEAKEGGRFLGWLSLRATRASRARDLELGFRLRREAWGRGYATQDATALLRVAFLDLGALRVFATTYQDNLPSRRVLENSA